MRFEVQRAPAQRDRELMLILGGAGFFKAVVAAHELHLFKYLRDRPGSTPEDLSQGLSLPLPSVRTLLMACAALRFVERDSSGRYQNAAWVSGAFAGPTPTFTALIEGFDRLLYQPLFRLTEALQRGTNVGLQYFPGTGGTLYERLAGHPALEATFHAWMSNLSALGLPRRLMEALTDRRWVLDVGGGDGTNAILIARANPEVRVTVLDLPSVCERAQARIAAEGLQGRIDTQAMDIRVDPFPSGCDAVLFSRIFNIYSEAQNQSFVSRAAACLAPGGRLLVFPSMVADDDETGPLSAAMLSLYYLCLATGEGRVYAPRDYEGWFQAAGFTSLECVVDERDDAVLIGEK
ncbi:MAG: methyltransferase [Myxococcota bacterium]